LKGSTVNTKKYSNRNKLRQIELSRHNNCDLAAVCHRNWNNRKDQPKMIQMKHLYHINIFPSKDSDRWIAHVPDLRGCSAHGDTPEEAMREVQIAIGLWLDVAREDGDPIPEPRYRPAIYAAAE
jgi:predicted RNase H-like HicB family nuclease